MENDNNSHDFLGKLFLMLFVIEVIGILFALLDPGSLGYNLNTNPIIVQSQIINSSVHTAVTSLNSTPIAYVQANTNVNSCTGLCLIGVAVSAIENAIIWVVNIIVIFVTIVFNILVVLFSLFVLFLEAVFIFLSIFTSTGIIGYLMGLGFVYIFAFVMWKIGHTLLNFVTGVFGAIRSLI